MSQEVRSGTTRVLACVVFAFGALSCAPTEPGDLGVYSGPAIAEFTPKGRDAGTDARIDEASDGDDDTIDSDDRETVRDGGIDAGLAADCGTRRRRRR